MTKSLVLQISWRIVLALALAAQTSSAVILFGSGDPAYNTTPPTGVLTNSGWQYEGQWGSFLGTPIAPQYFLAAHHVGGAVGQTFMYHGVNYTTTAYWDDPSSDLRLWQVSGVFPSYAPLYTSSDEQGRALMVYGRGTQRGAAVMTSVAGTNALAGWQDGTADGVTRWGQNQVCTAYWSLLIVAFTGTQGANEAYLSCGDSSGAVFIQDDTGVWKLAGINYAIDGPFSTTSTGPTFYGAIFNEAGLFMNGAQVPDEGGPQPAYFYATRVSSELAWIQGITGVVSTAAVTSAPSGPPQLNMQRVAGNFLVSYPTNTAGYTLQSSAVLGAGEAWQDVTNSLTVSGTNWNLLLPACGSSTFFRLRSVN
jgi:hypothetical protein